MIGAMCIGDIFLLHMREAMVGDECLKKNFRVEKSRAAFFDIGRHRALCKTVLSRWVGLANAQDQAFSKVGC